MNENRLTDLEIKYAHQELQLEKLQQALYDQQTVIDRLEKSLNLFKSRFESTLQGEGQVGPANEKPPHY